MNHIFEQFLLLYSHWISKNVYFLLCCVHSCYIPTVIRMVYFPQFHCWLIRQLQIWLSLFLKLQGFLLLKFLGRSMLMCCNYYGKYVFVRAWPRIVCSSLFYNFFSLRFSSSFYFFNDMYSCYLSTQKRYIFLLFFCFIVFLGSDMEKNWWPTHTHTFVWGLCIFCASWMNYVNDDEYVLCNLGLFQGLNTLFLKQPNTIWKFPTAKFCMLVLLILPILSFPCVCNCC